MPTATPQRQPSARERNPGLTKARILDAAEAAFAQHGFAGARLHSVARSARVQAAMIHHYFEDKRGLYGAVFDRAMGALSERSFAALAEQTELPGLVASIVDVLFDLQRSHQNLFRMLRHELQDANAAPLVALLQARLGPVVSAVTQMLEDRQRAGEVRIDASPQELAGAVLSLVSHPFSDRAVFGALFPELVQDDGASLARRKALVTQLSLELLRHGIADSDPHRRRV